MPVFVFSDVFNNFRSQLLYAAKFPCTEESRKVLVSGHIARIPRAGDALAAKQVPGCGCTDGQACLHRCTDIARINPHEQEGNSRIANAGGDCGSALARSNLLLLPYWRVEATGS